MSSLNYSAPKTLSIGLGGNITSHAGSPETTVITARPMIEKVIKELCFSLLKGNIDNILVNSGIHFCWSSLYKTEPIGGPNNQPFFINAVVIVHGEIFTKLNPSDEAATELLKQFMYLFNISHLSSFWMY